MLVHNPVPSIARSLRSSAARRWLTDSSSPGPAFCFDIDGVLKQGQHVLPQALKVMKVLNGENRLNRKYPFICLTNGGGSLELARSKRLTHELGVPIGEHQIVQSHTIFRSFLPKYADKPVLVVGGVGDNCRQIAETYGFKHAYIPADVLRWNPSIWPYHKLTPEEMAYSREADFSKIEFAAVLVFHDSRDWGRDIQLVLDLVRAERGVFGTLKDDKDLDAWEPERQLPVHFSQPDLLWGNEFPQSRFGQGALQESMAAVYKFTTGHELQRTTGGKPTLATYEYASSLLNSTILHTLPSSSTPSSRLSSVDDQVPRELSRDSAHEPLEIDLHREAALSRRSPSRTKKTYDGRVYMVGDNPRSDIAGANAFGWESILVQTGVFRGSKPEDSEHVPTVVKKDVW
ncbi:hypothetical protein JCM10212_006274, partial [Sporobolomyces blumeae]